MLVIIRDRIQAMINSNATLEEVKVASPAIDYDPLRRQHWSVDHGDVHRRIYTSLKNPPPAPK